MAIYLKKVPAADNALSCRSKDGKICYFRGANGYYVAPDKLNREDINCWGSIFIRVPGPQSNFQKYIESIANRLSEKIRKDIIKELSECNDLYEDTDCL